MRSAVNKALWVGRATSAAVGLMIVLALVVGLATSAFGADGGNFILGKTNAATLMTRLAGQQGVNGAMFEVQNNNAGADDTALSLKVEGGEAPMTVNRATKVTNLHADKVDGRDAPLLLKVDADGDLITNDTVAKITHSPNSGRYDFEFNRPVVGCVFQATLVNGPDGGEIAVYPNPAVLDRLSVITTANGTNFSSRYDRQFHLVLYC